jgi:hypothetical protein
MEFVVNEWLPEYFRPNATQEEKQKLETFLNKFMEKNDILYIRRPSEFLRKIYRYSKEYQSNIKTYNQLTNFIKFILLNSERCRFIDDDEFSLPGETSSRLIEGGNTVSDTYLFEAASATVTKLIITTDVKLKTLMDDFERYKVALLDTFLATY